MIDEIVDHVRYCLMRGGSGSSPARGRSRQGRSLDERAGLQVLDAIDDHHIAGLQALLHLPVGSHSRPHVYVALLRVCRGVDDPHIVLALQILHRALRHDDGIGVLLGRHLHAGELAGVQQLLRIVDFEAQRQSAGAIIDRRVDEVRAAAFAYIRIRPPEKYETAAATSHPGSVHARAGAAS